MAPSTKRGLSALRADWGSFFEPILFFLFSEKEKNVGAKIRATNGRPYNRCGGVLPQSARSADSSLLVEGA